MAKRKTKTKRGPTGPIHSVFFSPRSFSVPQGRAWLKDHDYKAKSRIERVRSASTPGLVWFGWRVGTLPKGKELRWLNFGPGIRAKVVVPKTQKRDSTPNRRPAEATAKKQQAFVFDPNEWTVRSAWSWLAKLGHDHRKAKKIEHRVRGRGLWFGWEVNKIPKGSAAGRWTRFGDTVLGRVIVKSKSGRGNPRGIKASRSSSTATSNLRPKVRTSTRTATRNEGRRSAALIRAARLRAEFLSNGVRAEDIPIDTLRIRDTEIPLDGLVLLGNYRQINYAAPKFRGKKWREYFHRPLGFKREGTKLKDQGGGLAFAHPKGSWILIVPGKNQGGVFEFDERGLTN